jgi:hypothetical protein
MPSPRNASDSTKRASVTVGQITSHELMVSLAAPSKTIKPRLEPGECADAYYHRQGDNTRQVL